MIISIHAPTRGATFCSQNQHHAGKISIHAPTRGATFLCGCRARREIISIHAPTRGATQSQVTQLNSDLHFNPRSHKGSDVIDPARTPRAYKISIHAPTRGATTFSGNVAVPTGISIHAPTRGATAILHKIPYLFYFIFTNPFPISYFHTQPASDF